MQHTPGTLNPRTTSRAKWATWRLARWNGDEYHQEQCHHKNQPGDGTVSAHAAFFCIRVPGTAERLEQHTFKAQFPSLAELLDADRHRIMADGALIPIATEQSVPTWQAEAKVAVAKIAVEPFAPPPATPEKCDARSTAAAASSAERVVPRPKRPT